MKNTTSNQTQITFILLAAGKGSRYKSNIPKQFSKFRSMPMIAHSLKKIEKFMPFAQLIICCEENYCELIKKICKKYSKSLLPLIEFARAGITRQQSVFNSLKITKEKTIILHEAARPLASENLFKALLLDDAKNITPAIEIPFTVLQQSENKISAILNRENLINIQLPQKFETAALLDAHKKAEAEDRFFTDDSSLLFFYGGEVKVIKGKIENVKLTYSKKDK